MNIGEKIKHYRLKRNISQKLLASLCGLSEPAIRNYELGNRQPSEKQIENIAYALKVSPYAISDPNLDTDNGIMHALFYLEKHFDLIAYRDKPLEDIGNDNSNPYNNLRFDFINRKGSSLDEMIGIWIDKKVQLNTGEITQEYYEEWCDSYPRLYAKECEDRIAEHREKKRNDLNL